jgi:hypothetical protein
MDDVNNNQDPLTSRIVPVAITTLVAICVSISITLWSLVALHYAPWGGTRAQGYQVLKISRNMLSTISINIFMGLLALPVDFPPAFIVYLWLTILIIYRVHARITYKQIPATFWLQRIARMYNVHETPIFAVLVLAVYGVIKTLRFCTILVYNLFTHLILQTIAEAASVENWARCCKAINANNNPEVDRVGLVKNVEYYKKYNDWAHTREDNLKNIIMWQRKYMRYILTMESLHVEALKEEGMDYI